MTGVSIYTLHYLHYLQLISIQSATKFTPLRMMFGREPVFP